MIWMKPKSHPSAAQRKKVVITDEGIEGQLLSDSGKDDYNYHIDMPDMLGYIQSKTELTRSTILETEIIKSAALQRWLINPSCSWIICVIHPAGFVCIDD